MGDTVIKVENLSKQYRLGLVSHKSIKDDFSRFWSKITRNENPFLKVGDVNDRTKKVDSQYVWSLKDVNFEIKQGEVVGIIGKNGAGKSTLLKILSKITAPTTGNVKINGKIASLLEVGTGFHPELTGRENLFLNGAILGMRKDEIKRKFDEIINFAEIEKYIDTPVKRYSSGMYVRLAFAIAAHLEPEILIVDEVLAVGDAEFQKKCLGKMKDVSSEGRTILFVSHNIAAIQNLCTSSIILENGTNTFSGSIEKGLEIYLGSSVNSVKSSIALSENRSGNSKVKFIDFYIESENGNHINTVLTNDNIILVFKIFVNVDEVNDVDLGFSFKNGFDVGLTNLYSSYQKKYFNKLKKGEHTIKCKLNNFYLSPGKIDVYGRILTNREEVDWLKDPLGSIFIEMGDFYGTGLTGESNWGNFLIKGEWSED